MASDIASCGALDGDYELGACSGPHACTIRLSRRTHDVNSHGLDPFPGTATMREVYLDDGEHTCRWQTAWGPHDGALPSFDAVSSDDGTHFAVRSDAGSWTIINLRVCTWIDSEQVADEPDWSRLPPATR
jgi:hypothetical protein